MHQARTPASRRNGTGATHAEPIAKEARRKKEGQPNRDTLVFAKPAQAQPIPIEFMAGWSENESGHTTAIFREWSPGDEQHCHLCPLSECQARNEGKPRCLIIVPDYVSLEDSSSFSLTDWRSRG